MDSSSIELKVMYGKDLKAFNFFQKLCVYVLVSIVSDDPAKKLKQKPQQRTPADKEGDGNPEWNQEMRFDLNEVSFQESDHLFIHFDLRHEGLYFGDKTIGEVRVPLKDLIEESNGIVRFMTYEVRTTDGKPNGALYFSSKVKGMRTNSPTTAITGYPILHQHQSPQIQHPASEIQTSSPEVGYPSLDFEGNSQETYLPLHLHCPSHQTQYSSQQNSYPSLDVYYPPPPPLPLLHQPPPPPPPPMADGACYHPPQPPSLHPWASCVYNYNVLGNWSSDAGQSRTLGDGETWPNFPARRDLHSSFWNDR